MAAEHARRLLVWAFVLAFACFVACILLGRRAVVSAVENRRQLAPSVVPPPTARVSLVVFAVGIAAAAAYLGLRTQLLVAELSAPVDPHLGYVPDPCGCLIGPSYPEGEGPDDLVDGPIITVGERGYVVDGSNELTVEEVQAMLRRKRELWKSLHPNTPYPAVAIIGVEPSRDARCLEKLLAVLPSVEIRRVLFAFLRRVVLDRPVLGRVRGEHASGLEVWLVPRLGAVSVSLAGYRRAGDAVEAFRTERREGHAITLAVGE
jgi:hypothetical protein